MVFNSCSTSYFKNSFKTSPCSSILIGCWVLLFNSETFLLRIESTEYPLYQMLTQYKFHEQMISVYITIIDHWIDVKVLGLSFIKKDQTI